MHFQKNSHMDQSYQSPDNQSSAVAADQMRRKPTQRRRDFPQYRFWRHHGLSVRAATAVAAIGCKSLDEIRDLGWHYFHDRQNCGIRTLQELSDLVGGWPDAPRRYTAWVQRAPDDVLIEELRRRGITVESGKASCPP